MPSGRPDWFGTIVSAGKYDSEYVPIAVSKDGVILAMMQGAHDSVLKTIAVDSDGIMKANLSVQDLDFLTVRPAYGAAEVEEGSQAISYTTTYTVVSISGRGVIYFGWIYTGHPTMGNQEAIYVEVDGVEVLSTSLLGVYQNEMFAPGSGLLYIVGWDRHNTRWRACFTPGLTFETTFELKIKGSMLGITPDYSWDIIYALIPT